MSTGEGSLYKAIRSAIESGSIPSQFRASDLHAAMPELSPHAFNTFLPKHRAGNPGGNSELFVRLDRGLYTLKQTGTAQDISPPFLVQG
jgi:hypothetical protein